MADEFVPPVRVLLKAIDTGIKVGNRINGFAGSVPAEQAQQILEHAPNLIKSLEQSSQAVRDAYKHNVQACGEPFTKGLVEDSKSLCTCACALTDDCLEAIQKRLKDIKNEIRDKIDEIDEDAEPFDSEPFLEVEEQAERCVRDCLKVFTALRDKLGPIAVVQPPKDDRSQLPSMARREPSLRKLVPLRGDSPTLAPANLRPQASFESERSALVPEPPKPKSPWAIDNSAQYGMGAAWSQTAASPTQRKVSRDISPSTAASQPRLIPQEHVDYRMRANDEWLERRRHSRMIFQEELRKSIVSIGSIEEHIDEITIDGPHELPAQSSPRSPDVGGFTSPVSPNGNESLRPGFKSSDSQETYFTGTGRDSSPTLGNYSVQRPSSNGSELQYEYASGSGQAASPFGGPRSGLTNDYTDMMERQRSQGQAPQARTSTTSSLMNSPQLGRQDGHNSFQVGQSGALSPPLSDHRSSSKAGDWSDLEATHVPTVRFPLNAHGIPAGLEVVTNIDYDNEKMAVTEDTARYSHPTPTTSMKSVDFPMRHDTSFYKFKGFCEGAKAVLRGENGFKTVKRPHVSLSV